MRAIRRLWASFLVILLALSTRCVANDDEAKIVYFIQVSESTLTFVPRLLTALWHPDNVYLVHIDKKVPEWQRDFSLNSIRNVQFDGQTPTNVHFLEPEVITYRGISMVINSMNAMQMALDLSNDFDFFINISGSDYPLVSPVEQRRLLATSDFRSANRSFFSLAPRDWWLKSFGFRATRLFTDTSLAQNGTNAELVDSYKDHPLAPLIDYTFVASESWMILHRSFVRYLLTAPAARRYFAAFAYISEPEEHFFATVAWNTPSVNDSLIHDAMRQVIWNLNGRHSGQHPFNVDELDADGNYIFTDVVRRCGAFFTRKVSVMNSQFLDIIDAQISGVAKDGVNRTSVDENLKRVRKRLKCIHPIREEGLVCKKRGTR